VHAKLAAVGSVERDRLHRREISESSCPDPIWGHGTVGRTCSSAIGNRLLHPLHW
jgi:hypothetical protein